MAATKKGSTGGKAKAAGTGAKTARTETTAKAKGVAKATETAAKTNPTAPAGAAAPKKKAAPVKINDKQREVLGKIHAAGPLGYAVAQKAEQRTVDALVDRKLVKKGAKNKETGAQHFLVSKAGEKHLTAPAPAQVADAPPSA